MITLSKRQMVYLNAIIEHAPALGINTNKTDFSRAELRQVSMKLKGKIWIPNWITHDVSRRVARGVFSVPEVMAAIAVSPGHETEGDGLADTATTPDVVTDDMVDVNEATVVHSDVLTEDATVTIF